MISEETRQKWRDYIENAIENQYKLSEKDAKFIDSIDIWLNSDGKDLTRGQASWLYDINRKLDN